MTIELVYDIATGQTYEREHVPSPEPEPIDPEIARAAMPDLSPAQLFIGLVTEGWISEAEGDAWLDGTLPAAVVALIATMPPEQQFPARARAKRLIAVSRTDPIVNALAVAEGKTPEEMDAFFTTYARV